MLPITDMCNGKNGDDVFEMREGNDSFGQLEDELVGYEGLPIILDYESEKAFDAIN